MSSALATITDYINDARTLLQDVIVPYRYSDAELIVAMNVMLLEGRRLRADLFVHDRKSKGVVPAIVANDGTAVPIEEQFRLAFLYGLCGHAIARDQEDLQDARAVWFLSAMTSLLTGKNPVTPGGDGA